MRHRQGDLTPLIVVLLGGLFCLAIAASQFGFAQLDDQVCVPPRITAGPRMTIP